MSVLKDFYYGNICPIDRSYACSAEKKAYTNLLNQQERIRTQLCSDLDKKQLQDFQTYCSLQTELNLAEQEDLFLYAFRLGARWERELFSERKDGLTEEQF
ncbi:MAG: hypothetical protein Q4E21_00540 [Clostridia bacterium]|nr:hypothetical protein [Clostridia bacterium]